MPDNTSNPRDGQASEASSADSAHQPSPPFTGLDPGRSDRILAFVTRRGIRSAPLLALTYTLFSLGGVIGLAWLYGGAAAVAKIKDDVGTLATLAGVLPAGLVLILRLYDKTKQGFEQLANDELVTLPSADERRRYLSSLDDELNPRWLFPASVALSALGNVAWLLVLPSGDWKQLHMGPAAWLLRVLVFLNVYVVLGAIFKSILVVRAMRRVFSHRIALQPLHPDGCGGLRGLGDIAMSLNYFLALIALFIWLKGFFAASLLTYWFAPIMGLFGVVAIYLFVAPLSKAHDQMKAEKLAILTALNRDFQNTYRAVRKSLDEDGLSLEAAQKLRALEHLHQVAARMPVWPYDIRIFAQLVGAIVVPPLSGFAIEFINRYLHSFR